MGQYVNFFFAVQAIIVGLLIVVILGQQSSSGMGGLAGGNNQQQFFAGRPEANFMTRMTTILTALFFISSIFFAWGMGSFQTPVSALDLENVEAIEFDLGDL